MGNTARTANITGSAIVSDTKQTMTAAELRAIGERIANDENRCGLDRVLLYAALERLIDKLVTPWPAGGWMVSQSVMARGFLDDRHFSVKDAAIDALLSDVT